MSGMNFNIADLEALVRLQSNNDFERILTLFREELRDQREANDYQQDATVLRHGQGRAQVLYEFIDAVENARSKLRGLTDGPQKPGIARTY